MKKIYIAGPMTGLPEFNYPAFHQAAAQLRALGHEVLNPAENPKPECGTYEGYLRLGITQMMACEWVALLPGWADSRGAVIECNLARNLKMGVVPVDDLIPQVEVIAPAAPALKQFTVQLHRRGGKTKGRVEVSATCVKHAERLAVEQTIEVSFPKSKPANWVVDSVEEKVS